MGKSKRGIIGTIAFHGGILAIIIGFGFNVPDPPPGEEGILINFGTDESGFGETEPMASEIPEPSPPPPAQEPSVPNETSDEIISQDFEEAPVVEAQETVKQERVEETQVEEVLEESEETPEPPKEEPRKPDERAMYKGRADTEKTAGNEGITEGDGNQGSISGSPDSDNYLDGLSGGGIDFSLTGRSPVGSLPKPEYNVQEAGKVVVKIRVNREGVVTWAEAGAQGTNTLNKELLEAARKAALKARFNRSPNAAFTQQGTITYHFVLE
jgi:TonB family protein